MHNSPAVSLHQRCEFTRRQRATTGQAGNDPRIDLTANRLDHATDILVFQHAEDTDSPAMELTIRQGTRKNLRSSRIVCNVQYPIAAIANDLKSACQSDF